VDDAALARRVAAAGGRVDSAAEGELYRRLAKRVRLYGLAQDKIFEDVPLVPLMTMPEMRVLQKRVRGYSIYPAGGEFLSGVSLE